MDIIGLLEKLAGLVDKFTQGRRERVKNKIDALTAERIALLRGKATTAKSKRLVAIENELKKLYKKLSNGAND